MKKNIIIPIVVSAVAVAGFYLLFSQRQTPALREAKRREMAGDLEQAFSLYARLISCSQAPTCPCRAKKSMAISSAYVSSP